VRRSSWVDELAAREGERRSAHLAPNDSRHCRETGTKCYRSLFARTSSLPKSHRARVVRRIETALSSALRNALARALVPSARSRVQGLFFHSPFSLAAEERRRRRRRPPLLFLAPNPREMDGSCYSGRPTTKSVGKNFPSATLENLLLALCAALKSLTCPCLIRPSHYRIGANSRALLRIRLSDMLPR